MKQQQQEHVHCPDLAPKVLAWKLGLVPFGHVEPLAMERSLLVPTI